MRDQDLEMFTRGVMGPLYLAGQARAPEPDPARNALYFRALVDLPIESLTKAAVECIRRDRFFPSIARLRELVVGDDELLAAQAWGRVHNAALKGYGTYRPLDFEDPVIHASVAAMGGWGELYQLGHRDSAGVDAAVKRKEFMQLYPGFLHGGVPETTPKALHCEQSRAFELPPMRLDALGQAVVPTHKALAAPLQPEPIYVNPPEALKELASVLASKMRPPEPPKSASDREYTPAEIEEQERKKQDKLNELRRGGLIS